jgi:hypothetical protein
MKRALIPVLLSLPLIHVAGCSSEEGTPIVPATGGSGGGTTTGVMGGSSGSAPMAGTPSTSGSTSMSGSGGAGPTAGTNSGGSSTAGSSTGGTGGGTTGGSGGSGGSAAAVSLGKLDGMLVMTPCKDSQSDDCDGNGWIYEGTTNPCVGGNLDTDSVAGKLEFAVVGGEMGKRYLATMHFYGVMEPKNYGPNATREAGGTRPNVNGNPSTPVPFATMPPGMNYRTSDYNTYEVHTFDETGEELQQYFINSDTMEGHYTFAISYAKPIEIVGGGKVKVRIFDDNCRMIKNCTDGGSVNDCNSKARSVDIAGASPAPTGLMQPGLGQAPNQSGQWFFIDVKEIVPKP